MFQTIINNNSFFVFMLTFFYTIQSQFYVVFKNHFFMDFKALLFNLYPTIRVVKRMFSSFEWVIISSLLENMTTTTTRTRNSIFGVHCECIALHFAFTKKEYWAYKSENIFSRVVLIATMKVLYAKMSKWRHIMVVMRTSLTDYYRHFYFTMFCSKYIRYTRRMMKMCISKLCLLQFSSVSLTETDSPISNNWREINVMCCTWL